MPATPLTGGCLCAAVRYECAEPTHPASFCHCESCRRAAGAHVVAWVSVRTDSFRVTRGALRQYASSPGVRRQFCERCGTPITYWNQRQPDTIDITVTTLDKPERVAPVDHIWMSDALSWDRPRDGLPLFSMGRPDTHNPGEGT